jgi:hypothetical protein
MLYIRRAYPNAGQPAPNNNMAPYVSPLGHYLASLYPDPNYHDPNNFYNYAYSQLAGREPHGHEDAVSTGT